MATQEKRQKQGKRRTKSKPLRRYVSVARDLGQRIVSGRYKPGDILDGEIESSQVFQVSRSAYREAVCILASKGLVSSRPKVGTRVLPQTEWQLLDRDVLSWLLHGEPDPHLVNSLFELRRIVETEAAAFAAARRGQRHLEMMRSALERMRLHSLGTEAGAVADQQFHAGLLAASDNLYLMSLTTGITGAIDALAAFKRSQPPERDAIPDHERVFDAIVARDPLGARNAMGELISLAVQDMPQMGIKNER